MPIPDYLTLDEYAQKVKALEGGHWTPHTITARWDYHARVIHLIQALGLDEGKDILEMGTMGVQCVKNGRSMDYVEKWDFPGKNPDLVHDARHLPWPVKDKEYGLFVALRVFQHLTPFQKECTLEVMRIAKKAIILVPATYDNPQIPDSKGIAYSDFVEMLDGIHPNLYTTTRFGNLYYWDTEHPSYMDIEGVMTPQEQEQEPAKAKAPVQNRSVAHRLVRRVKMILGG
ncbi:MAG: hypothetical protein IPH00_15230 [Flavobacteriales bacterium]|nr:hypothetical protein [Flavobacteriales bacterium]QQS73619.1 MAG: hypothetical protein IPP95_05200 [Flavobacteriales bacterium]HQV37362.1 hypothetical protein [Flavobacteriales bacterium]HQW31099.1 hypothetical protein [Flavobacteriales bacterium]HQY02975.1 hypothetical protein [Flavobacteriales bacterium]